MDCWIARAIHLCDASAGAGAEVRVCLSNMHYHRTLLRQALNSLIGITLAAVAYIARKSLLVLVFYIQASGRLSSICWVLRTRPNCLFMLVYSILPLFDLIAGQKSNRQQLPQAPVYLPLGTLLRHQC